MKVSRMSNQSTEVMFVLPTYVGGGAERIVVQLARSLHRKGRRVLLVGVLERASTFEVDGLPHIGLGCGRVLEAIFPLLRVIKEHKVKTVVSTLRHITVVVASTHFLLRTKFRHVIRVANTYSSEIQRGSNALVRAFWHCVLILAHRSASANICVSHGVRKDLVSRFCVTAARCVTIYNPVNLPEIDSLASAAEPRLELKRGRKLILAVGRLTVQKDFVSLIEAFSKLKTLCSQSSALVILGEGPERPNLEMVVETHGLRDDVYLLGWVSNPYPFFRSADVFVLSSKHEGLPNALLEALAFELPVVTTDCESGPREIITDTRLGALIPIGDVEAMAGAICEALAMTKDVYRRSHVSKYFEASAVVQQYEKVLLDA